MSMTKLELKKNVDMFFFSTVIFTCCPYEGPNGFNYNKLYCSVKVLELARLLVPH